MFKDRDIEVLRGYENAADETELYYVDNFEVIKGFLPELKPEEIIQLYKTVKPCTCGNVKPIVVEYNIMGDTDSEVICEKCGKKLCRSMYDYDVENAEHCTEQCIKDWNDGLSQTDIDRKMQEEKERISLTENDMKWTPLYPNNMPSNGQCGIYTILLKKETERISACKWIICYQRKETEPLVVGPDVECYNLFVRQYDDVKIYSYPEPTDEPIFTRETFGAYGVNDYGTFVRSYKTLEEAKKGAVARCGVYGINRDTMLRL